MVLQIMVFGFLNTQILVLQVIVMLIEQAMLMIEKALLVVVFILETIWFLGIAKSKTLSLCPLQRLNILLLEVVALNNFG